MIAVYLIGAFALNSLLGAFVLSWLDAPARYNGRILAWVRSSPAELWCVVPIFVLEVWPYFVCRYVVERRKP